MTKMAASGSQPHGADDGSTALEQLVKDRSTLKALRALALELQRRQIRGPSTIAAVTAKTLRMVVSKSKFQDVEGLIEIIRTAGGFLQMAQPGGESGALHLD